MSVLLEAAVKSGLRSQKRRDSPTISQCMSSLIFDFEDSGAELMVLRMSAAQTVIDN
jgi:hypothetical protein